MQGVTFTEEELKLLKEGLAFLVTRAKLPEMTIVEYKRDLEPKLAQLQKVPKFVEENMFSVEQVIEPDDNTITPDSGVVEE